MVCVDLMGYANVEYTSGFNDGFNKSGWDGSGNLLRVEFNGARDALEGAKEVLSDTREVASTSINYLDYATSPIRVAAFYPIELVLGDKSAKITVENRTGAAEGDVFVLAVNGLNNTLEEYKTDVYSLSVGMPWDEYERMVSQGKDPGTKPYPVHYIYNDSFVNKGNLSNPNARKLGATLDVMQAFFELGGLGMIDNTSRKIGGTLNEALEEGGYSKAILALHSQGGIKGSAAMSLVKPELRDKVTVINYGSAHIKPFLGAKKILNVHREYDFVTNLVGQRHIRQYALDTIFNTLGSTDSSTVTIPSGNVRKEDMMLKMYPYTHSFEMIDKQFKKVGYETALPNLLHQEIYKQQ
jgi:hypothetical protein